MSKNSYNKNVKFGTKIPRTWNEAVAIDKENGDTQQWQDAVREETTKVRITFKIMEDGTQVPPTYQEIRCHLIFDVKIENFRRKARTVAGGHVTETLATLMGSVVSRESVPIALAL
jgi:hypothetical protein